MRAARLSVIGFGEFRPTQPNDTVAGRDANRRVVIVILAGEGAPAPSDAADMDSPAEQGDDTGLPVPEMPADALPTDVNTITQAAPAAGTEPAPLPVIVGTAAGIPAQE